MGCLFSAQSLRFGLNARNQMLRERPPLWLPQKCVWITKRCDIKARISFYKDFLGPLFRFDKSRDFLHKAHDTQQVLPAQQLEKHQYELTIELYDKAKCASNVQLLEARADATDQTSHPDKISA
jgi:hypothetical protein